MFALISDIHGNLEALQAVFDHIDSQGIDRVICLGDLVGYGPDPEAVVDLVAERCEWSLSGNHDYAMLTEAVNFNPVAKQAIDCFRERMKPRYAEMSKKTERWEFLTNLLLKEEEDEYIVPHDVYFGATPKIQDIFNYPFRLLFVGHTHLPGIITEKFEFLFPTECDYKLDISRGRYIVNVSSVGQPRDRDPRTCYATFDGTTLRWHRLDYDYQTTMDKIGKLACLNHFCADRLAVGR